MGYIDIPVYQYNPYVYQRYNLNNIIGWFADIHTGSRIDFDFSGDTLLLRNLSGDVLEVEGYNPDSLFRLIQPKTDSGDESNWYSVRQKCSKTIERIEKNLQKHIFTDRELYNIYINAEEVDKTSNPAWYVGDIRIKNADQEQDNDEENIILYIISMEIRAAELALNYQYTPIKHEIEDKLTELYFASDVISVPDGKDEYWRSYVLSKMIIALKGFCIFEDVDSLTLRREHIIEEKYPWMERVGYLQHPMELWQDSIIQDVTYDFPIEETWADVIKSMGTFSSDVEDDERIVKICMDNIIKTIRFMQEDPAFQRDIISSLKVFDNEKDENRILNKLSSFLLKMVVTHELGHMTFRSIREDLTLKERESLANWFSCLFADLFNRNLVALLVPYQGEEYQDFIEIPDKYKLKKKQYQDYCTKINSLLRSW